MVYYYLIYREKCNSFVGNIMKCRNLFLFICFNFYLFLVVYWIIRKIDVNKKIIVICVDVI